MKNLEKFNVGYVTIVTDMSDVKFQLKEQAIILRKRGFSYREIMTQIPVAKSTISLWLRSVGMTQRQKQRLTEKKLASIKRGAEAKRRRRILLMEKIISVAQKEIGEISRREFWLIGTMLYWAEGSKEKDYDPGCGTQFTNTDPDMIRLFLYWLKEVCNKTFDSLIIDLYIHDLQRERKQEILAFWIKTIDCSPSDIKHIYYKKGNLKTMRKNVGKSYHGTLRITVKASSSLNRRIAGWTKGVVECLR